MMIHLLARWLQFIEPLYRREILSRGRVSIWPGKKATRGYGLPLVFGIVSAIICTVSIGEFWALVVFRGITFASPILIVGVLMLLAMLVGRLFATLSVSDVITHELAQQTWTDLRTLPYTARQIIDSKYLGSLKRAESFLYVLFIARLVTVAGAYLAVVVEGERNPGTLTRQVGLAPALAVAVLYSTLDFYGDFAIDIAIGVTASTFSRTSRGAMLRGGTISVVTQIVQYALMLIVVSMLIEVVSWPAVCGGFIIAAIAAKVIFLRVLLALAARRAEMLPA
jgi:ABC-type transport system involved in multi-copper enzyme maturation permease subunit